MHQLSQSIGGAWAFAVYFVFALLLLCAFIAIYIRATPYRELRLIRAGNKAAAMSLGGALLGFAIALAKAIEQSAGLADMLIWAAIALVAQIIAYLIARLCVPGIRDGISDDQLASGIFLAALSVSIGVLNAASMTS